MRATVPAISADDSGLSKYLREIRDFPVLEPEQEYMLAKRWVDYEDTAAAHQLVTSHLRLVAKIAMGYRHYGLPMADLISEGNLGLMRAVKKFEPERGFRLSTYAMWWIKASLNEFVLNSWSLVKIGTLAAQKKLFFNLRKVKTKLRLLDATELAPADVRAIAKELGVSETDVVNMNRRMGGRDSSLNTPVGESGTEIIELLPDETDNQETGLAKHEELSKGRKLIAQALGSLNEREREIFVERRLRDEPMTLEELGARFGVSRERIRQIEVKAFEKVRTLVSAGFLPATA
ncbi:sigma H (sigma 32) factor of RNA polymerase; transcription of heat shock and stress proteins [Magnetospirillum gryphiswaldense MSR-1 v2]|uniref:RNA polymerase sigma factor RpoH n=1 Tax=Magnetospirillum gryphiswaldense (strain DSM 6361 / JCM 21280 / NBRC 15271 / MSR-1) TaxID=431944 RepID=V6EY34_MAGGM|nr:RNA polymerase sigma factor RpoH [Magnetospirillum gryphiswaldense]CDK98170.1 sigma H (sigma 32) factor of RNA polymerase; transcription of heat shock and stress proteins [Magnetospirillum gryphiswaldense MSR-1 v2]